MSSPKLHRLWGFEWADVTWANYCPARTEQSPLLSEIHPHPLAWPASWSDSDSIIFPLEEVKILCIHRDNRAEVPLGRKCLPDFVRGAELTPLNFMVIMALLNVELFNSENKMLSLSNSEMPSTNCSRVSCSTVPIWL